MFDTYILDTYIKVVYLAFFGIFMLLQGIGSWASMVLQNYQNFIELTSNMIYIVAFGGGSKCPCKIHLNTQDQSEVAFNPIAHYS